MTDYKDVRTTQTEEGRGQRYATFKATQLIWLLLTLLEAALALRVVFKLIGVNGANPFATLLYGFHQLFRGAFCQFDRRPIRGGNGVGNFYDHRHDRVPADRLGA